MGLHKLEVTPSSDAEETNAAASRNRASSNLNPNRDGDQDEDTPPQSSDESSSTGDEDDNDWDGWESDPEQKEPCVSLFDATSLPSATDVLKYDKENHGFDLEGTYKRLGGFSLRKSSENLY